MDVGLYIKQLRTQKGLSQEELGKIVGVQRAAVQKWESGATQNLKRTTIQKLASYFDVSPIMFVDGNAPASSKFDDLTESNITEEPPILKKYNKLNDRDKERVEGYIDALLPTQSTNSDTTYTSKVAAFGGASKNSKITKSDVHQLNDEIEEF